MRALFPSCLVLAACAGPRMPDGEGRGLVGSDARAPEGVATHAAPAWQPGDRFVFVRGSTQRLTMHVQAHGDHLALVDDGTNARQIVNKELADLGYEEPLRAGDPPTPVLAMAPADVRYHWPLWPGKRWSCHFLRKAPGHPPLPLLATYSVECEEEVRVPAGSFRALRILRRATVAAEGTYLDRTTLSWYAPEVGVEVRRLEDGLLTELAEVHRQTR